MKKPDKKKTIITIVTIAAIAVILNIPVVSDVIAMTRVGMIGSVTDMEKTEYEGEKYWQFSLDDEYDTRIIVVEHNIFRVTVRIFEDSPCFPRNNSNPHTTLNKINHDRGVVAF